MFVLISEYLDPDGVTRTRPAHVEWLEQAAADGRVLAAGRRVDGKGGILVVPGSDEDACKALIAEDPYDKAGVAEYAVHAFTAKFTAPAAADFAESS